MAIAITEDHQALGATVADLADKRQLLEANRSLLEATEENLPAAWDEIAKLGWLGLHVPEAYGGSGFGLEELVVVVEELARKVAPGPFVPTVIASAAIAASGDEAACANLLPGLADGSRTAAVALGATATLDGSSVSGSAGVVLGGGLANLLLIAVGDDVAVVEVNDPSVTVETPPNLDPSRRSARVTLDDTPATVLAGGAQALVDLSRVILSADAVGIAAECTHSAAEYAKERIQFGRPIAMFQAVKHHCANMAVATEMATAATWDAARAAATGGDQLSYTAAVAATLAAPAADLCANLNTQVHGGIAITWEHEAHLYLRRATTLLHFLDADGAAADLVDLARRGVTRAKTVELPPEAETIRADVRAFVDELAELSEEEQKAKLVETGYAMPHWPKPYGRAAGPIEQLVIEQEFGTAKVTRPSYGITGWNILTLIQYGTEDQVQRWVKPALDQEVVWCQLFSEPDAGSDAAGVTTKGTRVDGGWLVNGQKVWTSGAHDADVILTFVRTDPDAPKHKGISVLVIPTDTEGVVRRPFPSWCDRDDVDFNEVFFTDVRVPAENLVGPLGGGWGVANGSLGHERTLLWMLFADRLDQLIADYQPATALERDQYATLLMDAAALRLMGSAAIAREARGEQDTQSLSVLKLLGSEAVQVHSEHALDAAGIDGLRHPNVSASYAPFGEDDASTSLFERLQRTFGGTIAGGTSEIQRTIIAQRILGLPR